MTDRSTIADELANALEKESLWFRTVNERAHAVRVFARVLAEHETQQEDELRRLLWLHHHCHMQYGDDGEQQCNDTHQNGEHHAIGPLDFKRDDFRRLASAICSMERWHFIRAEAAEARCAQLEQERDEVREALTWAAGARTALQAEHERLRAALEKVLEYMRDVDVDAEWASLVVLARTALAPSRETTT